jgi:hypothetical protein
MSPGQALAWQVNQGGALRHPCQRGAVVGEAPEAPAQARGVRGCASGDRGARPHLQTRVPRTGVTCPETRLLFALERAVRVRSHVQWLPALAAALCARVRCPALTILHHSSDPTPLLPAVDARACPATQAPRVSDVGVATTTTRSARAFQRAAACSSNLQPRAGTPRPRRPRPRLARAPTATCAAATLR